MEQFGSITSNTYEDSPVMQFYTLFQQSTERTDPGESVEGGREGEGY